MLLARNRNFRLFFSAAGITNLGDGISALAFPWLATLITRDPFLIGLVAAAQRFPWLFFALPAGVITDRVDRRLLLVRADLFRMILTFGVVTLILSAPPLPLADGAAQAWPMILGLSAAAFLLGTAEVFRDNAAQTAMPQIVEDKDLEQANGQLWSIEQIMGQFIGPPVAGLLIALSVPLPFAFDAVTFGVAAALVWWITMRDVPLARADGFWKAFREGATWMARSPIILRFAVMLGVLNFVTFGSIAILVLFSQEVLGLSAAGHGLLLSAGALGAVLGSLTGPRIAAALGGRRTILLALAMFTPAFLGTASIQSSPGRSGKPWKFNRFANLSRQVVQRLSQPAVRRTVSPGTTSARKGSQSSTSRAPFVTVSVLIADHRPAAAPEVTSSRPRANQSGANPASSGQVKARPSETLWTCVSKKYPVAEVLNLHAPSPSTAVQGFWNTRPWGRFNWSVSPRNSAVNAPPPERTSPIWPRNCSQRSSGFCQLTIQQITSAPS